MPRGRRVGDHEVVRAAAAVPARALRQLPDLGDRDQLLGARRGGDEVLEGRRAREHLQAGAADLPREPLLERLPGVDRDRPQVLGQLDLGLRDHPLAAERARDAVLLRDLADDRAAAGVGRREAQRSGHRRLPDAALPGDVQEAPVPQECFHRMGRMTMGAMDPSLSAAYDACRRLQLRHDPTYYWATRRLPADVRPATHALYGYVRTADQIVDGPDRPATPDARRAALDAWEDELLGGRSHAPGGGRARRRRRAPRAAARRARPVHALDAGRLRAGADRHLGGAARLHGRLGGVGRPDHGAAARRARAPSRRLRPPRPGVPARELRARRARGLHARPHLPPRRGSRAARRRRGRLRAAARDPGAARARRPAGRSRAGAVRGRRAGRGGRARVGADRHPDRVRGVRARARPRRGRRRRRPRAARRRARWDLAALLVRR